MEISTKKSSSTFTSIENKSNKLPTLIEFTQIFHKYPSLYVYNLVRDLVLKADSLNQEHEFIILDGKKSLDLDDYIVLVHDKTNNKQYIYVSFTFEQDLDLNWMYEASKVCEAGGFIVVLSVHSIDGITYQIVESGLPSIPN